MNFTYENNSNNTYLVYEFSENDVLDTVNIGMLTNNKIKGLAPAIFTQTDLIKYVKYNVSAKVPISQYFDGIVNKKKLVNVFSGILEAILIAEEYMIPVESILLNLDYIFVDVSTNEVLIICLPFVMENSVDLNFFFKNIMFSTQFDSSENCDYVAKIINYLNNRAAFSTSDFRKLLVEMSGTASAKPQVQAVASVTNVQVPQQTQAATVSTPIQTAVPNVQPTNNVVSSNVNVATPPVATPVMNNINKGQYNAMPTPGVTPVKNGVPGVPQIPVENQGKKSNKKDNEQKKGGLFSKLMGNSNKKEGKKADLNTGFAIPGQPTSIKDYGSKGNNATINSANNGVVNNGVVNNVPSTPIANITNQSSQQPVQATQSYSYSPQQSNFVNPPVQSAPVNFAETTVLNQNTSSETTVLGAVNNVAKEKLPVLIRIKNNERIVLNKPRFRIGREKSYVDYCVLDNNAVGRSHADVIVKLDGCYIMDMNSTNHTYVNGEIIQSGTEIKLENGDKIFLANEAFEFKIM